MIRDFKAEDVMSIKLPKQELVSGLDFNSLEYGHGLATSTFARTLVCDKTGDVLACAGFSEEILGNVYGWALISHDTKNPILLHKAFFKGLRMASFRRIYIRVHSEFAKSIRWVLALGFKHEGTEHQFLEGHNFERFSLIRDRV